MNYSKLTNISDNQATMRIYKHIGYDEQMGMGVDGNMFAENIEYINENYPNLDKINVRINSGGGNVQEGYSIVSAILGSKIPVDTYIDGMAYSMAGVIAMCGKKVHMADFGSFMMHEAGGGSDQAVLDLITNSLATIFESTRGLTIDKCKELMSVETWLAADECLKMGLVDEVIKTNTKVPVANSTMELHAIYNKIINPKKQNMNKLTNLLKLQNEAGEDAIVEAVEEIKSNSEAAAEENETLKAENEELKAKIKAFEDIEAEKEAGEKAALIEDAVKTGKIAEKAKDLWVNAAVNSTELKEIFSSINSIPVHVNIANSIKVEAATEGRSDWTIRDWEKKDPKGLQKIANETPEIYQEMYNKFYKK